MRITFVSDQPTWLIGRQGPFEYRYSELRDSLVKAGHDLSFIYLSHDSTQQALLSEGREVTTVPIVGNPKSILQQISRKILDVIAPRRALSHDNRLNSEIRSSTPDAVICLVGFNPELVRNISNEFPTVLFAEENFSLGWDNVSEGAGVLLRLRMWLRNSLIFRAWSRPDLVIVVSDPEIAWATRAYPGARVTTIPIFLPEEFWLEDVESSMAPIDIFAIGKFDSMRNAFGLRKFLDELKMQQPINTPKVHVACWSKPHQILDDVPEDRLTYLGKVDDPRPFYKAAKICVVPAFSVSGAKNQVLQGWATQCPVVSSTQSALSVNGIDGKDLLAGATPRELAMAALTALSDVGLREHLVSHGARSLLERHTGANSLQKFADELALTVQLKKR